MRVCAGAATWMLSRLATSVFGEPSAPTLDATCGTERAGRIRPAGGRPGRPAVLAEARRPNREPPPGARARRGVSHKTWPRKRHPCPSDGGAGAARVGAGGSFGHVTEPRAMPKASQPYASESVRAHGGEAAGNKSSRLARYLFLNPYCGCCICDFFHGSGLRCPTWGGGG